jgi:hypothetical protein
MILFAATARIQLVGLQLDGLAFLMPILEKLIATEWGTVH